jgi:hypothetical protein
MSRYRLYPTSEQETVWHLAFAAAPDAIAAPGNGASVGVDRGVAVSTALSNGDMERAPGLRLKEAERLQRLERRLPRATPGSKRRGKVKAQIAKLETRAADRRKDWAEKLSTRLARDYDQIALEQLNVKAMTACAKGTVEQPGRNVTPRATSETSPRAAPARMRPRQGMPWLRGAGWGDLGRVPYEPRTSGCAHRLTAAGEHNQDPRLLSRRGDANVCRWTVPKADRAPRPCSNSIARTCGIRTGRCRGGSLRYW